MAGKLFANTVVDVGFGDPWSDDEDMLSTPGLFAFVDVLPVEVPAIPISQHLSEKVHAYTRRYGSGGSSRMKDLIDMVLFALHSTVMAEDLRRSLERTFAVRDKHALPIAIPPPDDQWTASYRKLAEEVHIAANIYTGFRVAARLIDPALGGDVNPGARWNHEIQAWE